MSKLTNNQKQRREGALIACDIIEERLIEYRNSVVLASTSFVIQECLEEVLYTKRILEDIK